ncbi:MAG: X-Pro aminopeptidase [Marinilabiliales bacterium]|nr:MAG: X-Pro aminopeptidase [Marinilabiliales bacterium]
MRYLPIDKQLFVDNRKNFSKQIKENSMAIFFSADQSPRNGDQFHAFRQQSDLFYLCGIDQEKSILIIAPDHPNKTLRECLFLLKTNEIIAKWEGHKYTKEEAKSCSGIESIFWLEDLDFNMNEIMSEVDNVYLNRNEYPKFFPEVEEKNHREGDAIKSKFPLHNYFRSAPIMAQLRGVKSDIEKKLIEKACNITDVAFRKVLETTKPGMYEFDIQAEVDYVFTKNRANGHGYAPIIASGKNACVLHYIENNDEFKDGDLLLMDFGAEYANYTADMSRTIPVNGKFTKRQKQCYNAVLDVFKELKKLYVKGNSSTLINEKANELMGKEMVKLGLFTEKDIEKQDKENPLYKKYFMHGVCHPIGLDVHDIGSKHRTFEPGMILTLEPGIYIEEENIGIRIENDILITEGAPVDMMKNIPIEVEEIESLMNKGK